MRSNLPDKEYFINKRIPGLSDYIINEHIDFGMNAHMYKAHNQSINSYCACKVIPVTNLINYEKNPGQWLEEVLKANILDIDTVAKYFHATAWKDSDNKIDCVALCANFIKGENLEKYIRNHSDDIIIPFVREFLFEMINLFNEMGKKRISHGDLHTRNIIVEDNSSSLRGPAYRFRVTDFGVASQTSNVALKDDYDQLALMLRTLLENIDYQKADARDRYIYNILNNDFIARHLIERDATRDYLARNPTLLYQELERLDDYSRLNGISDAQVIMKSPFDYPSLEQFGDSYKLLKELYSELFLGLNQIEEKNNLVLTGPRGCGKSTSFKSMSLLHKIRVDTDKPDDISYIGIYYRCDDLYFAFSRYKLPLKDDAFDLPLHFLTASLLIEVLRSVEEWSQKHFKSEWEQKETKISIKIWSLLSLDKPGVPGSDSFRAIINRLNRERERATKKQRVAHDAKQNFGYYFGPDLLVKTCETINRSLSFLYDLPYYFFIDDYSMPKVSDDLQKNLNRLLMQRTPSCYFKIATESPVSYVRNDIDGKNYVEGREFALLNLGIEYIHANRNIKYQFIDDIFERRFRAIPDYPVKNLEMLLGNSSSDSYNDIAMDIRQKKKPGLGGKDVLCDLCSGDIHYIISLVGNMVQMTGGKEGLAKLENKPITINMQNRAIRDGAGNFLKNLVRLPGGEKLVQIVTAFGNVAHHYLLYKDSKNEELNPPHQASRIEPLERPILSSEAEETYRDLLRYSVFIEDLR
ncbi:MAG: protein kinase, partial [Methanobacterium sp.]